MRLSILAIALLSVGIIGCSKESKSSDQGSTKSVFSTWTSAANGVLLDFRSCQFNAVYPAAFYDSSTDEICLCSDVLFSGDETSGSFAAANCSNYSGPVSGNCPSLAGGYTFQKSGSTLSVCDNVGCVSYQ